MPTKRSKGTGISGKKTSTSKGPKTPKKPPKTSSTAGGGKVPKKPPSDADIMKR